MLDVLREPLDIWDAYDVTAEGATTYAGWIASIDSILSVPIANGDVAQVDLGAGAGGNRLYSYTAGAETGQRVLLTAGVHGNEYLSMGATLRWFEAFATSSDPAMETLRAQIRVTWVPTVNVGRYRTDRLNANGINLNRNFAFHWNQYPATAPGDTNAKGAAGFDQPETAIIRDLITNDGIAAVVDCHTTAGYGPMTMGWASASPYIHSNRGIQFAAAAHWDRLYREPGDTGVTKELDGAYNTPDLVSWAAWHTRFAARRWNGAAVTLEGPDEWRGSTSTDLTRDAIRGYCGFITLWIAQWLVAGQSPTCPQPISLRARRTSYNHATSLTAGGTLLDTDGPQFVQFNDYSGGTTPRSYADFIPSYPCRFEVTFTGQIESLGGTAGNAYVELHWGSGTESPTTSEQFDAGVSLTVPAAAGRRAPFAGQWLSPYYDASQIRWIMCRLRLGFSRDVGVGDFGVARATVTVRPVPDDDVSTIPVVGGSFA